MKKKLLFSFAVLIVSLITTYSFAQITISGSTGIDGNYLSLTKAGGAFAAINAAASQSGNNILITINADVLNEDGATALNAKDWLTLKINPAGARIISGKAAGKSMISFNGADFVTIDGLNSGGNSLTISNDTVSSAAGTSTIRFQSDASNNLVTQCSIKGSSTTTFGTNGGVIAFGTGTTTGNDNNTISYCDIGPSGTNLPSKCFGFNGSTGSAALFNSGDTIRNCNIYDYFRATAQSAGVHIDVGNKDITILDNKFYQTSSRTQTTGTEHSAIWISTAINSGANNFNISGNVIGFANSSGTGSYTLSGIAATKFRGIYISIDTIASASSIQGNTVSGISMSGTFSGITTNSSFAGIYVSRGLVNVGDITGNTIGSLSDTSNITLSTNTASAIEFRGIFHDGINHGICSNNLIGGITAYNAGTGPFNIFCIVGDMSSSKTFTCQNNIVGGTVLNSIQSKSTSASTNLIGIYNFSPSGTISGNVVRNISASAGTGTNAASSVLGILNTSASVSVTISQNDVYGLNNYSTSTATNIAGICFGASSATCTISRNLVHNFNVSSTTAAMSGIHVFSGNSTSQNNMIQLGLDTSGSSINTGALIYGIYESGGTNNFYFNSVHIGGSPVSGSSNTFSLNSTITNTTRNFKNNIFSNARSNNGSTGKHYAVRVGGTSANPTGLTMNNNDYFVSGSGGVFGLYNSIDRTNTLAWQLATGQDAGSINSDPKFILPDGSASAFNLHINASVSALIESHGADVPAITEDYDGQTRSALTPVDIGADAGNFILQEIVLVTGALTGNGSYVNLSQAFNAINAGAQTSSNITVTIYENLSEPPSGAVLNNNDWATIKIQPAEGTAKTISSKNTGTPLINLNGADNVTIDGLNSGGNSLTISNDTASSSAGTSTIRFQSDASNNLITRCSIKGSSATGFGTNGGVIAFGTGTSTGNDNNTVSYCDIGPSGINLPTKCIGFVGSTGSSALFNSGDTIRNCNIFDYFSTTAQSAGIQIDVANKDISILNNKFYQTSSRTQTSGTDHAGIWISTTINTSANNFNITGNTIGFANSLGTGTYSFSGIAGSRFRGIYVSIDTIPSATSIQGNTIAGISMTGTFSGTSTSSSFMGIYIARGLVNIGTITGNTIGSQTDTSNIVLSTNTASGIECRGINFDGVNNGVCSNNNIGGITVSNSSTGAFNIFGIVGTILTSRTFTCQNNIVGGTVSNSIRSRSTSNNTNLLGIYNNSSSAAISNNIIRNISAAAGTVNYNFASVIGISNNASSSNVNISQNQIYSLTNSNISAATFVTGIYHNASFGTNLVSKNFIHNLAASSASGSIYGMHVNNGLTTFQNNMIQLGLDIPGNSINTGLSLRGFYLVNGVYNFCFNSIYIGGSPVSGSGNSYAFYETSFNGPRINRNNILYNARSNAGSIGKHYSIHVEDLSGLTSNNNDLYTDGNGGTLGFYFTNRNTLTDWINATGKDSNSFNSNPGFINPAGSFSTTDLHINNSTATEIEGTGFDIGTVTDDYDGEIRSALSPVDIGADAGNFVTPPKPVTVANALGGNGMYSTLRLAFNAINGSSQTGANITIGISDNITENLTATLNSGTWQSLTITPSGGARTVTGSSNILINLNGADNVKIDGLNSAGNSLTISNSNTGFNAATIKIQNDATNNTVTGCTVLGSYSVINIGGTSGTTGNDYNTISECNIGPAGSNLPIYGIYGYGNGFPQSLLNTGDTIKNCNIYDYFSATQASYGIYFYNGNGFVIQGNKLYQTSPRTQTTGNEHTGISAGGGGNSQLLDNTVGFSSAAGTGYYVLNGTSGTYFNGIYFYEYDLPGSVVRGNNVAGIYLAGDVSGSVLNCYSLGGYVKIENNNAGNQTQDSSVVLNSSSASNDISLTGMYSYSYNDTTIANTIGGLSASNSNTGSCQIQGLNTSGHSRYNLVGGNIPNSIKNNSSGVSSSVTGIYSAGNNYYIGNNTVKNITGQGSLYGILDNFGNYIKNNTIKNLIGSGDIYGIYNGTEVANNKVYALYGNNLTNPQNVFGIYSDYGTLTSNFVHSLNASSTLSTLAGVYSSAQNYTGCFNNMIRLGIDSAGNGVNTGCSVYGIFMNSGGQCYSNSVYIGGAPNSGSSNSFAFYNDDVIYSRYIQNNIFFNARSNNGSSGKHYALQIGGEFPYPVSYTDYNVYYANGNGSVFGKYNGFDVADLAAWRTATAYDVNSFYDDPKFINPNGSNSNVDLHIHPADSTITESNGTFISGNNYPEEDYDAQMRSSLSPVDIGADAGNFQGKDLGPPKIIYSPLYKDSNFVSRSFMGVQITDYPGVNVSPGTMPRVYYKKLSDANTFNDNTPVTAGWKYSEANGVTSPFDFTIDYSKLNSPLNPGDTVQYFVVAQDIAAVPKVAINSGTFNSSPSNVNLTAAAFPVTGTINNYRLQNTPLAGDYFVGLSLFNNLSGRNVYFEKEVKKVMKEVPLSDKEFLKNKRKEKSNTDKKSPVEKTDIRTEKNEVEEVKWIPMENGKQYTGPLYIKRSQNPNLPASAMSGTYARITDAVSDLYDRGIDDAVRFLLIDTAYTSEVFPIYVYPVNGASSINTVTIKPSPGVVTRISNNVYTIQTLSVNSSYVIIDGSNTDNGTTRDLTIESNQGSYTVVSFESSFNFPQPLQFSGFKNCIVRGNGGYYEKSIAVCGYIDYLANYSEGLFNNIEIENNSFQRTSDGVFCLGYTSQGNGNGLKIKSNEMNSPSPNCIMSRGIILSGVDGAEISYNNIGNFYSDYYYENIGIQLNSYTVNTTVEKNKIHDLGFVDTLYNVSGGGKGVLINTGTINANIKIINNFISNIYGPGSEYNYYPMYNPVAIMIDNLPQSGINILNNSIHLFGNTLDRVYARSIGIYTYDAQAVIKNNIISNSLGLAGATGYGAVGIYKITGSQSADTIENNLYYINPSGSGQKEIGSVNDTGYATLSAWRSATGFDLNSAEGNPLFVSNSNLHITSASSPVNDLGAPLSEVTTDIDDEPRNPLAPDIGADEINAASSITLNLTLFIEGFYDANTDSQVSDTVKVVLRNAASPYAAADSASAVISSNGNAAFTFNTASAGVYYLVVKHRNSIETWSKSGGENLTGGSGNSYDFSNLLSQAFGNNMKQVDNSPNRFAVFGGDVNQDGFIDLTDITLIFNDAGNFASGYLITDLTGDNVTDLTDLVIAFNNSNNFVSVINP